MDRLITCIVLASLVTGCVNVGVSSDGSPVDAAETELPLPEVRDGFVHVDVPVPVYLIGYPDDAVAHLTDALTPESVHHSTISLNQALPPDPSRDPEDNVPLRGDSAPIPIAPTGNYQVTPVDASVEDAFAARLADWRVSGGDLPVYDGRAAESFLADALPEAGHALNPETPAIVLVHLDAFDVDVHTWRYDFQQGWLEPVRVFGERTPMLFMDVSGTTVPPRSLMERAQDTATGEEHDPYEDRLGTNPEDLDEIVSLVRAATHYRILQGSIYPTPLADCHAITTILAYRPTGLAENTDVLASAEEMFQPDQVQRAFENLTGDPVHVDVKLLELPVDDPALDALSRGEFATFEAQRGWLAMNWEDYWVEHEGCEAYVSFLVQGDAASLPSGVVGIGTYDTSRGYRISLSWINEAVRALFDPASPVGTFQDESHPYNWVNNLFTHEAGHTIGMRHPHDVTRTDGGGSRQDFQDVWSSMSYSVRGRVIDFSVIEQANWQRNRAGYMINAAVELGLEDNSEFTDALEHVAAYEWNAATAALGPLVRDARAGASDGDKDDLGGVLAPVGGVTWIDHGDVHAYGDARDPEGDAAHAH